MPERSRDPLQVLVAGGGPGALEGALALQSLAGDRVAITLVAAERSFHYRPLSVNEPFGFGTAVRYDLAALAEERWMGFVQAEVAGVYPPLRRLELAQGDALPYDALLLALGAWSSVAVPGAVTFRGGQDVAAVRRALAALRRHEPIRVAFVAPAETAWTLPLYELALLTARWAQDQELALEPWLVTHEPRALAVFGADASAEVGELLDDAGVRLWTGAYAEEVADGRLWLSMEGGMPVDLAVALGRPEGPRVPGLPSDERGFVPVGTDGAVPGLDGVFAVGDMTARPLKQGGLATQQADAAAVAIARLAGADVPATPYEPVLRGVLFTGGPPRYLRHAAGDAGEAGGDPLWWPPHKIAGRHLAPYLAAHPELRVGETVPS
jgi:sulfide:quinone oxidoreductase